MGPRFFDQGQPRRTPGRRRTEFFGSESVWGGRAEGGRMCRRSMGKITRSSIMAKHTIRIGQRQYPRWVQKCRITQSEVDLYLTWTRARGSGPNDRSAPENFYESYLRSARWQRFRAIIMVAAACTCADCGGPAVDVHHLTYQRLGSERLEDVLPLCRECHEARHGGLFRIALNKAIAHGQRESAAL